MSHPFISKVNTKSLSKVIRGIDTRRQVLLSSLAVRLYIPETVRAQ